MRCDGVQAEGKRRMRVLGEVRGTQGLGAISYDPLRMTGVGFQTELCEAVSLTGR